jgi:DNA polymerase I-like protein with 3'-5' exonuclease and polymerase domains
MAATISRAEKIPMSNPVHDRYVKIVRAVQCRDPRCWCQVDPATTRSMTGHCLVHDDQRPSFAVKETPDKILIYCHGGCAFEDTSQALRLLGLWPDPPASGLTLAELAAAKALPVEFLKSFGVFDRPGRAGTPASVGIPYYDRDGHEQAVQIRLSLEGHRFRWKDGAADIPYGLPKLGTILSIGYTVIVEGASDVWTGWYHDIPAIGVPSATSWKAGWAAFFPDTLKVYVWVEDDAGFGLLDAVLQDLPDALAIFPPDGTKDLSALHLADLTAVKAIVAGMIAAARPASALAEERRRAQAQDDATTALAASGTLLDDPAILDHFGTALEANGYAGDTAPAKVTFLVLLTSMFARPVNLHVSGLSGIGKNFMVNQVLAFVPAAMVYTLTASSEHTFVYTDESFEHRHLFIEESAGMHQDGVGATILRGLSWGQDIRYETVVTQRDGTPKTIKIHKPGPTGVITTSVKALEDEMRTRFLTVALRDDPAQTKLIVEAIGRQAEELPTGTAPKAFVAAIRWLQLAGRHDVVIPYGRALAGLFDTREVRARRDFSQLLNLIRASALLHQRRRTIEKGRVRATLTDYAIVHPLVTEIFAATGTGLTTAQREAVAAVAALCPSADALPVTTSQVAERLGISRQAAAKRLERPLELGYVTNGESRERWPAKLSPGDRLPEASASIPTPRALADALGTPPPDLGVARLHGPGESAAGIDTLDDPRAEDATAEGLRDQSGPMGGLRENSLTVKDSEDSATVPRRLAGEGQGGNTSGASRPVLDDTLDAPPASLPDDAPIAVDVETVGPGGRLPVPWTDGARLVCVGFAADGQRFAFPAEDREAVQVFLALPNPKVFHNAAYDITWLKSAGLEINGPIHDTSWMLAFENGVAARGLKPRGTHQYAQHLPKDTALYPSLVRAYCANDALNTLTLYDSQSPWLRHRLYQLYQSMAPRLAQVSLRGLPVFRDRFDVRIRETEARLGDYNAQLMSIARINWRSAAQVARFLEPALPKATTPTTATGRPSVADAVLRTCKHAAAPILLAYRAASKLLGTYLRPHQGRECVHGLLSLGGAWTGRTSSRGVNIQNIPRSLRTVFGLPGFDWVKIDFQAAELVVVATIAGCEPLLEALRAGRDPHAETATRIFSTRTDSVTSAQRAIGKTLNFGLTYGGRAAVVAAQAEEAGIPMTRDEAERFRDAWFRAYPEIASWHEATEARLLRGDPIESAFGRRWRLPTDSFRQRNRALAAPISSTASDLLLMGTASTWDALTNQGIVVNLVHDEIDVLIPSGSFDAGAWHEIARAMAAIDPRFPMRVEVAVGPDWGSTVKQFVSGGKAS